MCIEIPICLADTFRCERKSSTRQRLLQDKVRNDNVSYKVKRHCLLQDIFSKKTLSVPTVSVETLLVVRHFLFLSKKTLSVMRYFQFWGIFSFYQKDIVRYEIFSVLRHLQFILSKRHSPLWDIFSFQRFAVVRHFQLFDTCSCPILSFILFLLHFILVVHKGCPIFFVIFGDTYVPMS